MRHVLLISLLAVLSIGAIPDGDPVWRPTTGGWVAGPVDYVRTLPTEAGTAIDAALHDDLLYVTSWRSFSIYDVSDPLDPERLSVRHTPGQLLNEEPETNGDILLLSHDQQPAAELHVWDVRDPRSPQPVTEFATRVNQHMFTCVLDCAYVYGARGAIIDLRDPSAPVEVGDWTTVAPFENRLAHAIEEVAPGIVMTGSHPGYVLDAREDPANPDVLATYRSQDDGRSSFVIGPDVAMPAQTAWPQVTAGRSAGARPADAGTVADRFALVSTETPFSGNCADDSGGFATFDTRGWEETGRFELVDDHRLTTNGTFTDGRPPANAVGCSAFGFDLEPGYGQETRTAAVAWFEHGVRLLEIDDEGRISEIGGFVPHAGSSAQTVWLDDGIVYVVDLERGIDILRVGV